MCSQADDPSQHVSDDTLRAALDAAFDAGCDVSVDGGFENRDKAWIAFTAALAASATDEPIRCYICGNESDCTPDHKRHVERAHAASATDEEPTYDPRRSNAVLARPAVPATDEPERNPLIPTDEELRAMWEALPPRFAAVPRPGGYARGPFGTQEGRPAVPEALDVERLLRAFSNVGVQLHEDTWHVNEYDMPEIAREYAVLRSKEPTDDR